MDKAEILDALTVFAEQEPDLRTDDYDTAEQYDEDNRRYCIEPLEEFRAMRDVIAARDEIDANALARAVQWIDRISMSLTGEIEYRPTRQRRYATEFRSFACNVLSQALVDSWAPEAPEDAKPLPHAEAMAAERLGERIAGRWFR